MPELSIRKIIEKTLSGEIRIPSFQRGFVWEPEKVAFFIDSLYKGYPIGSLLFWRTNIRLENERQLGNYSLPEPTKGSAPGHLSVINAQGFCWPQLSQSEHDSSSTSTKEKVNFRRDSPTSISSLAVISPGITTAA